MDMNRAGPTSRLVQDEVEIERVVQRPSEEVNRLVRAATYK